MTACAIEEDYVAWTKTHPKYIYQTVTLKERRDEVFSDHFHTYNNLFIAAIWNHYRSVRILLNELLLDQLTHFSQTKFDSTLAGADDSIFESQMLASKMTLLKLCHDICASVPYFLGFDPNRDPDLPYEIPKTVHGNMLIWPLYTAGVTPLVSDVMRSWVAGRLQWIADVLGVRQANLLAFKVRNQQEVLTWEDEEIAWPAQATQIGYETTSGALYEIST